ncbi:MAG: TetR/AcrR family transcriptional regulator [Betaproteobacteria bacterium]|nr:TetR/AcrR family transcriptional regulator [Betaproteobacteria bacterium]
MSLPLGARAAPPVQKKRAGAYHHGDLKRALMDAALALVRERGPGGFKLVEICRAAGVSQAAFYRHFETREQLLAELAREGFEKLRTMVEEGLGQAKDAAEAVRRGGLAYLLFARDCQGHLHLMFSAAGIEQGALPQDPRSLQEMLTGAACVLPGQDGNATEAAFAGAVHAGEATFTALVAAFARLAELPGKTRYWSPEAAPAVAVAFWAMVHGVAVLAMEGQLGSDPWGDETQAYLRDWLLDPWLRGLAAGDEQASRRK